MGHSAGAAHVAGFVAAPGAAKKLAGCICISGLYDLTISPVNAAYFGADPALYAERSPLTGLARVETPLLVLLAEHDPEFVQRHGLSLLDAVLRERKKLPQFGQIAGHNHFSSLLHLNSPDTSLADQLNDFMSGS
jgi:triacylglycerol lipase